MNGGEDLQSPGADAARLAHAARVASGRVSARLRELVATKSPAQNFTLRDLFESLSGRGHAAVVVVLALPFCLPLPLFGLSTVFGAVLAFIGLRVAFGHRPWLPKWILNKPVRAETVLAMARRSAAMEWRMRKLLRPRLTQLCRNPWLYRAHGITIAVLAVFLALPLPIPFSNVIVAFPILLLGLALLEDDGAFVIVAYVISLAAVVAFLALVWAGGIGIERILDGWRRHLAPVLPDEPPAAP